MSCHRARADDRVAQVFTADRPTITDIHTGGITGVMDFTIDVPVERDWARRLRSVRQPDSGRARGPGRAPVRAVRHGSDGGRRLGPRGGAAAQHDPFIGSPVVSTLWSAMQSQHEGIVQAPTLEGTHAIAAYTHITPFNWAVAVGAPEEVVYAPIWAAVVRVGSVGVVVLSLGLVLALFAVRGITRPIEQLRRLAAAATRSIPPTVENRPARSRHGSPSPGDRGGRTACGGSGAGGKRNPVPGVVREIRPAERSCSIPRPPR